MRETKYRAWDKKLKEMFPVHELVFNRFDGAPITIKGYTHDEKDVWNIHGGHKMMYANAPRYELLEYTGLKDNSGKEIYESDIVDYLGDIDNVNINVIRVIEYKNEEACFVARLPVGVEGEEAVYLNEHDFKVVGNIYENPELLGDSE